MQAFRISHLNVIIGYWKTGEELHCSIWVSVYRVSVAFSGMRFLSIAVRILQLNNQIEWPQLSGPLSLYTTHA